MPDIIYSNNPNEETAFVEQEDGSRNRVVLTAAVEGEITYPDNPNSTKVTVTVDGVKRKAVAVATIVGGGDSHNKGYFATQEALEEAYPTGEAGDYAIVESTDTVWIWDSDNSAWVDSDQKGQVTSVNGQTGDVVLDLLPSQTGNSGKFLTTDGTDASWSDKPLVNRATGPQSDLIIAPGATVDSNDHGIVICSGSGAVISGYNSIAIGSSARTGNNATCLNAFSATGTSAIQIGGGVGASNSDANTFKVGNANGNFEIMSADGTIPTGRLTKVNTTGTLAVADWSSNTQTISVTGVTATSVVFVSPDPLSASDYASAGILCSAQNAGTLTFTCDTTPTNAITVNIVCL